MTVYTSLITFIAAVRYPHVLQRPRVVQACDRLTGGMFVAFGVELAAQRSTPVSL